MPRVRLAERRWRVTARTNPLGRHAEIDSRGHRLPGYDDPRASGSATAESVFAMQTNARTLHGSKRAAWRRRPRGKGARERTRVSSAARSATTQEWFTHFFDDAYVAELSNQKSSGQTRHEVDFLLRSLRVSPRSRILDVACGYGRHAAELSRRGFRVVGADLSRAMLAEARQRFREGPRLRFVRGDMRRLHFAAEFDAVFSFFTSFGYFAPGQNEAVLRRMARALRLGGRLLVDHRNPTHDAALPRRNWYRVGRRLVLGDHRFDPRTKVSECTQLVVADGRSRAVQRRFRVQEFSLAEWRRMLGRAGLRLIRAYAGYDGRAYRAASSERLIVLAEKTASGVGRRRPSPRPEARP